MAANASLSEVIGQVGARVLAILGPATYPTLVGTERWPAGEISDACIDADGQVVMTFLQKAGDGRRVPFLLTANVLHAGVIPSRIGEIDSITIAGKVPIRSNAQTIERDRVNPLGIPLIPKIFTWGDTLFHNATVANFGVNTAAVVYADYSRSGALQSPSEYSAAIVCLAIANIIGKAGNHSDSAQMYHGLGMSYLGQVGRGAAQLAPLPTHEEVSRMPQVAPTGGQ